MIRAAYCKRRPVAFGDYRGFPSGGAPGYHLLFVKSADVMKVGIVCALPGLAFFVGKIEPHDFSILNEIGKAEILVQVENACLSRGEFDRMRQKNPHKFTQALG